VTCRECYENGKKKLGQTGIVEAETDARLLLEQLCGLSFHDLLAHGDRELPERSRQLYEAALALRERRIPLQRILGTQDFMGLTFLVNGQVLIPRQDTEILVEEALRELHDGMRILDLCTGSGCVLISLLRYSSGCRGVGTDISPQALAVAKENAGRILGGPSQSGAGEAAGRMPGGPAPAGAEAAADWIRSDMWENVDGVFDLIVSNPPYIRTRDIPGLMPEVRLHEPIQALDGGEDGLAFYRNIISGSRAYLAREGKLFLEIGYDQARSIVGQMEEAGFSGIRVVKDYGGRDRVVRGVLGKDGSEDV
jgi:release factor glutamine methyltransferase